MILSELDKADLIQLATGDADPQTAARADKLIKSQTQAARFYAAARAQCELLSDAFVAAENALPDEPLTPREVKRLTAQISQRVHAMQRRRVWRRVMGVAAAVALIVTPLAGWKYYQYTPIGQAVLFQGGFTAATSTHTAVRPIHHGTQLQTQDQSAGVNLGASRLAAAPNTSITFGHTIRIESGRAFIVTPEPQRIEAPGLEAVIEGESLLSVLDDAVTCNVLTGSAHLTTSRGGVQLNAGEQLIVTSDRQIVEPAPTSVPLWVDRALRMLDERSPAR